MYRLWCEVAAGGGQALGSASVIGGGVPGSPCSGSGKLGMVRGCAPPGGAVRFWSLVG